MYTIRSCVDRAGIFGRHKYSKRRRVGSGFLKHQITMNGTITRHWAHGVYCKSSKRSRSGTKTSCSARCRDETGDWDEDLLHDIMDGELDDCDEYDDY
jgi:hypothetical protein